MYKIVTLEEVENLLKEFPQELLAFDTETDGFYGPIQIAQFHSELWSKALLVLKPDPYYLAKILKTQPFIAHLAHYDITTIQEQTGTAWIPDKFHCTFYASRLFYYRESSFSLDSVLKYVLGYDPYEKLSINKKELQKSIWTGIISEEQLQYAALDVLHLLDIFNATKESFGTFNYKLDILFTRNCLDFQWNGMPVIESELQKRFANNLEEIKQMDMPINVNSWQQVRKYIDEDESDALALTKYKLQGNHLAGDVLKTRKIIKQNSFLKKFDSDTNKIYGKFVPTARSGRCTSKDQNLEQIPRLTKLVFGFETDKRVLLYADYSQLELRAATVIIPEPKMEKLYRNNEDVHGHTTIEIIKPDYDDRDRYVGKTCNFNLLYYGSANMLGNILIKEAEIWLEDYKLHSTRAKWLKLWPSINAWQRRGVAAWKNGQPWSTPLGRRYVGNLMTDQLNIQISGFGAEVAKLATHYMSKELGGLTHNDYMLCNFIHDSWIWECINDPQIYKSLADTIARAMQDAWFECCKSVKIKDLPMPVEVFVGYNWGKIEKEYIEKFTYK